jgi:hypothetical protein
MRLRPWTLALVAALSLTAAGCSGCQVLAPLTSNNSAVLQDTVMDEKGLLVAEAALFGANTAAEAAVDNGLLAAGSPKAVQVADYLDAGKRALDVARAAYRAGDAKTMAARLDAAQDTIGSAMKLIPRAPE